MGILRLALVEEFAGRAAVVSSFGAESAVLLHMVAQIDPATPILFLNTGKLYGETLRYRDRLQDVIGLTDLRSIGPNPSDRADRDPESTLWSRDPDACCNFRKVVPVRRALEGFDAQITGRKRFQTHARAAMEKVEFFEGAASVSIRSPNGRSPISKPIWCSTICPAIRWWKTAIPPLAVCRTAARRVQTGEAYPRWPLGQASTRSECGIPTGLDGEGI